jgi:adenosylcobyric acid synthase
MGLTSGPDTTRPFAAIGPNTDGAISKDGLVTGTYLHGMFESDRFRHAFLDISSTLDYEHEVEATLTALAQHLERSLDLSTLLTLAAPV